MKSFAAVIAIAAFGVTGLCRADEQAAAPPSGDVGAPSLPLKAVLSDFVGNHSVGSVVWHTDDITSPGQPPAHAVRADIEIPDLGMTVRLDLRRNDDKQLPASHTVEILFTLPPDFPHGEIANVPGLLMKADEMARSDTLKGVSVKVADNFFLIGLSSAEADKRHNIQLIKERSWIDIPIAYSSGKRADIVVEKPPLGERPAAVLGLPAGVMTAGRLGDGPPTPAPAAPFAQPLPWPIRSGDVDRARPEWVLPSASGGADGDVLRQVPTTRITAASAPTVKLYFPVLSRPLWAWPPQPVWWAAAPGSMSVRRTWQAGWQPARAEAIRVASSTGLASTTSGPTLPPWLQAMSVLTATDIATPSWPRVRAPDFHIPTGESRVRSDWMPPAQFVRWSDRLETVLSAGEVARRCEALRGKPPPRGKVLRGCTHGAAGRCFIIRIDDPGVARHELAHCAGWKHPE